MHIHIWGLLDKSTVEIDLRYTSGIHQFDLCIFFCFRLCELHFGSFEVLWRKVLFCPYLLFSCYVLLYFDWYSNSLVRVLPIDTFVQRNLLLMCLFKSCPSFISNLKSCFLRFRSLFHVSFAFFSDITFLKTLSVTCISFTRYCKLCRTSGFRLFGHWTPGAENP